MSSTKKAVTVFISYTHADESFKDELIKHLSLMRRNGDVSIWHDRDIAGGREWKGEIDTHLEEADLILLLISTDFIASDYCWDVEMKRARRVATYCVNSAAPMVTTICRHETLKCNQTSP